MRLKAPVFQIDPENPFKNDLLDRLESAAMLTELASSLEDPFVLCIDAPWGQGKTTFLSMWRQHLENSGFVTLHFNAWENDFSDDALISLIGEIDLGMQQIKLPDGKKAQAIEHLKKIKRLGASLAKRAIPVAAKVVTAGVLDLDKVTEEALAGLSQSFAQDQINNYESSKKTVQGFKKELETFSEWVSLRDKEQKKPIIFIIDELDRCRPTYAIEVLEKAKHFFNVPNLVFVLAVDKEQLTHSIRSVYGQGMEVNGYLKRFIDLEYILPPPKKGAFSSALFQRFGLKEYFQNKTGTEGRNEYELFSKLFAELFEILDFSLREQEQCFSQLSIAIRTTPLNQKLFPILLCTLIVLKAKNTGLYRDFISNKADAQAVLEYIKSKPGGEQFVMKNYGGALEAYLIWCNSHGRELEKLTSSYVNVRDGSDSSEDEKTRADHILRLLESLEYGGPHDMLGFATKKLEIASRFS